MKFGKKGVSLIAVMLFMLIATIAATGTYKWLSSMGSSSASRMQLSEASHAASSGVIAARTWMANHGNETGALIRQYLNNGKKPIQITDKIAKLNQGSNGQTYDVWFVGANTTKMPYTVKLVSTGMARDSSAKYSEVAILQVSGLYQVKVPQKSASISFDKAFQGTMTNMTNSPTLASAIINGDAKGNVPKVTGEMVVTGSVVYQGGTLEGADLYVNKDFSNQGAFTVGRSGLDTATFYVGGNMKDCAGGAVTVYGDMYVGGNVASNCKLKVSGNLTINGNLNRGFGEDYIGRNFVFTENGKLSLSGDASMSGTTVGMATYLPKTMDGAGGDNNGNRKADLGSTIYKYTTASIAVCSPNGSQNGAYDGYGSGIFSQCDLQTLNSNSWNNTAYRYFSYKSTAANNRLSSETPSKWSSDDQVFKNIGNNYWTNISKMNAYGNLIASDGDVPQAVLLNDENTWKNQTANARCAALGYSHVTSPAITSMMNSDGTKKTIDDINSCYAKLKELDDEVLYNGFMVVEFTGGSTSNMSQSVTDSLSGKFIFYFNSAIGDLYIPPTTSNSVVMLYLAEGGSKIFSAGGSSNTYSYNYFVYTEKDVAFTKVKLDGSVIVKKGAKANLDDGDVKLNYNAAVLSALATAGVITSNPEYEALVSGGTSSSDASTGTGESDSYYIATGPQLYVAVGSEYKNKELDPDTLSSSNSEDLDPSIIILPRILYLSKDPKGSLPDYYDVVNLNGANESKNPGAVSCNPSTIPTTQKFSSYTTELSEGIYKCNYESTTYGTVPFYIVVNGTLGTAPTVSFEEPNTREIGKGGSIPVKIVVPKSTSAQSISVDIYQSALPTNWTIDGPTPTAINSDESRVYTITATPSTSSDQTITAFTVYMPETGGGSGGVDFQMIEPCDGCLIGTPSYFKVVAEGTFKVQRKEISDYCNLPAHEGTTECSEGGDLYTVTKAPSCGDLLAESSAWVNADGINCNVINDSEPNDGWECSIFIDPDVHLKKVSNTASTYCDITIPTSSDNYIYSATENSEDNYLYASITRKSHTLHVKVEGTSASASKVKLTYATTTSATEGTSDPIYCDGGENCDITVYSGYKYFLTTEEAGGDNFSTWKCTGEDCPSSFSKKDTFAILITKENTITAKFNDVDKHCFYEDFNYDSDKGGDFYAFCSSNSSSRCIDYCATNPSAGESCAMSQSKYWLGRDKVGNPDWVMVYDNRIPKCSKYEKQCTARGLLGGCIWYEKVCVQTSKSGDLLTPVVNTSGGYVTADSKADAYADETNGTQAVILSSKEAGSNGTLTSNFSTDIFGVISSSNGYANSGFIFRSNEDASEYYSIGIYGKSLGGLYSNKVYFELCRVSGQTAYHGACTVQEMSTTSWGLSELVGFTSLTKNNIVLTIDGNTLTLDLTLGHNIVQDGSRSVTFDLSHPSGSDGDEVDAWDDADHEYVGMKLSNKEFKVYDISWQSKDYESDCWDYPKLDCSFKSNYLGGVVPLDSNVSPWASLSSYADDKYSACSIKYYYNGCDNTTNFSSYDMTYWESSWQTSYACMYGSTLGAFWTSGTALSSNIYHFTMQGKHGYAYNSSGYNLAGYVMDAKVMISCPSNVEIPSSFSVPQTCGEFLVGKILPCSKNYDLLADEESSITCSDSCSIATTSTDGINAREATLYLNLDNVDENKVKITLRDKSGKESMPTTVSTNGTVAISVDGVSDVESFNPQEIAYVNVKNLGSTTISVSSAQTSCPYALGLGECTVSYNGNSWIVRAEASNATSCSVNVPSNSSADKSALDGSCSSAYQLSEPGLLATSGGDYTFSVTATNGSGDAAETVTKVCNTVTISPVDVSCSVSPSEVYTKSGVPSLSYSFTNCPSDGCNYTISLEGQEVKGTATSGSQKFDNVNTIASPLSTGMHYFTINASGVENTSCGFNVVAQQNKATASSCNYSESSKRFTADIAYEGSSWNGSVNVVDGLGNNIGEVKAYSNSTNTSISVDLSGVSFSSGNNTIALTLNGGENGSTGCTVTYSVESSAEKDVALTNCPTSVTDFESSYKFTPTVTGCDDGCSLSISGGGSISPASSYKGGEITISGITSDGSYSVTASNGSKSNSCTIPITVKASSVLDVDCQIADQSGKAIGSTISVQPHQVTGCNSDCSYSIMQGMETVTSGNNYSGAAVSFTDSKATAGTKAYTLKVTDSKNNSESCSFNVAYAASSSTCACATYCGSGCESNIVTGNVNDQSFNGCLFITDASRLSFNTDNGGWWKVNGNTMSTKQPCYDNSSDCANALSSYSKVDGGWYITANVGWASVRSSGYNPCVPEETPVLTSCNPATATVAPGKTVTITPSLSTSCETKNGCNYAISGDASVSGPYRSGTISFADASATDGSSRTYSLTISNSKGLSASCPITISYDASASTTIDNWTSSNATLTAGTYVINKCSGNSGSKTVQLSTGTSSDCLNWFSPSASWSNGPWGTCSGQVTISFPVTLTVPTGGSITYSGNCW